MIEINPADYQNHAWLALDYGTTGEYDQKEGALNLFHYNDDVAMFTWCLRQRGQTERVAEMSRVFNLQDGPPERSWPCEPAWPPRWATGMP